MLFGKCLHIINNQYQIAATTSSRHLPCMNLRKDGILINEALNATLNHGWEHGYLSIKRCLEGRGKGWEILSENGIPTVIGCLGKILHLWLGNVLAFYHGTARTAWLHRNHADMTLHPGENVLVKTGLELIRPETVVIIVTHQSRHTDSYGILCPAHNTIAALRIVLETEHQLGKNLRIHIRQLHRPDLLDHIAGRSRKTATLTYLEGRNQRHGYRPARSMAADVRLVYPGACQIKTGRKLTGGILDVGAGTCLQALGRRALQHNILNASLLTEPALGFAAAVCIHHEDVRLHKIHRRNKVHNAITLVDKGILYIFNRLHHEKALLLGIERLMMLVAENRLVGTYTYV